jgi:hypothetical protein
MAATPLGIRELTNTFNALLMTVSSRVTLLLGSSKMAFILVFLLSKLVSFFELIKISLTSINCGLVPPGETGFCARWKNLLQ